MITKPMLAGKAPADLADLTYPVLATPKLDGIRCLIINGKAVSRTFKPIPNDHIRHALEDAAAVGSIPDGIDGELMVHGKDFNAASGDIRRSDGSPDFIYHVFDYVEDDGLLNPYSGRMEALESLALPGFCALVLPREIYNLAELHDYERVCLEMNFEGVMVRSPESPYKCGRSSTKEGYLLKVKQFEDAEAIVVGYEEEMENCNEALKDAFGRTKRSTHAENLVPKGTLGKLICRLCSFDPDNPKMVDPIQYGEEFGIGTGFTAAMRADLWAKRDRLKGEIVKFKHQPSGAKEGGRPRLPVFLGWRDKWDM